MSSTNRRASTLCPALNRARLICAPLPLEQLRLLQEFNKDLAPSGKGEAAGAGSEEGMDIGWKPSASPSMLSVSQVRLALFPYARLRS